MTPLASVGPCATTEIERQCLSKLVDYSAIQSIAEIWPLAAQRFGNTIALKDPHSKPEVAISYNQLASDIQHFAAALQSLGVAAGDRVALFADNSPYWFIADQGTLTAGAANAVRSSQAERDELLFILANSGSTLLIAENWSTCKKLQSGLADLPIRAIILLSDEEPAIDLPLRVLNFNQMIDLGKSSTLQPVKYQLSDLATLIYTSGTTGRPKGVMLSQANLIAQITRMGVVVQPEVGDPALSILPTWHSYERTVEYFLLSQGCTQIYTSIRYVKQDLKQFKPAFMVAVPRLWESIYEGVQKQFREQPEGKQKLIRNLQAASYRYKAACRVRDRLDLQNPNPSWLARGLAGLQALLLMPVHALAERLVYRKVREATGGQLKCVISGGGSLATHLDAFFEVVGIEILVGYGLTETSPILTVRRRWHNLRGSSGLPLPSTEIRIVDPETRQILPIGQRGLVLARGPQIMQGYYQNPEATQKAIDPEGWFDTGDLGYLTADGDIVLTGRAKDTIVLTSGENIEPQPIEDACLRSTYIDQIMLVGQDQKILGALIVPNIDALKLVTLEPIDLESPNIQTLFRQELNREVQNRPGYRPDNQIGPFRLLPEPFTIENGLLTQTLKVRRNVVMERYRDLIQGMFTGN